jgi:Na+/H+ antiporter NhaC
MTLEIIVFIAAILFGIVWYWRESKSNKLYRLANKITHAKDLKMKPDNQKGFIHQQPFLLRLVWVTLLFALGAGIVTFVTPINVFFIQYFASAIVGTLIGTYIASAFIFTRDSTSKENIEKVFDKGKEFVEELVEGDEEVVPEQKIEVTPEPEVEPKKSARDRFKDKGMIK